MTRVAIGVITCRRPVGLGRLLDALEQLDPEGAGVEVSVIVVDNDPEESSRALVEERGPSFRWPLAWYCEPRRGIPFARNQVVRRASEAGADFVAFIDDDEEPAPDWLNQLLRAQEEFDADVVTGPVIARYVEPPPPWMQEARFFDRPKPRVPTGTPVTGGSTANVLLRCSALASLDGPFNEEMVATGGSDAYLIRQLGLRGARVIACDEAIVYEWIPASRARVGWILRRAFRTGLTRGYTEQRLARTPADGLRVSWRGLRKVLRGGMIAPASLFRGRPRMVQVMRATLYGAGMVGGVLGVRYDEYRVIHGD